MLAVAAVLVDIEHLSLVSSLEITQVPNLP
jgi:hypothetical protein